MQSDIYTKTVLTIIAAGVLFIAFRDIPVVGNAQAEQTPSKAIDVNIVGISGQSPTGGGFLALPVWVMNPDTRLPK